MDHWERWKWELISLLSAGGIGTWKAIRGGRSPRLWDRLISFLSAPIERDIAQRENRALRADNDRLAAENQRLRDSARPWSGGSSKNGDGKSSSSSPPSSPTTRDPFTK